MKNPAEARVTPLPGLDDLYFSRMASSLGDKKRILDYLPSEPQVPGESITVLDVGAGGGEFSDVLENLGYEATALDASPEVIERIKRDFPEVDTYEGLANWAEHALGAPFDAVVASSVLHEVFSYGDDHAGAGAGREAVIRSLTSFWDALKPGGVLVVRDGVRADNWDAPATLVPTEEHATEVLAGAKRYFEHSPFANGSAVNGNGHLLALTETSEGTLVGDVRSAMEFAYTYTWGDNSFTREVQELYGVETLDGYQVLLEEVGFQVETKYSYLQPGYPRHLNPHMRFLVEGTPSEWPMSNAIWVARKPA